jgi:hypothetical protein
LRYALAIVLVAAACGGPVPETAPRTHACETDNQCDPADFCVDGHCQGASASPPDAAVGAVDAGPDGGPDAGSVDAGTPDAGGVDAGTPDAGVGPAGRLTLSPATASATVLPEQPVPAQTFTLGNTGPGALSWTASCTQGVVPAPQSGTVAAGAQTSVRVALPAWKSPGTQTVVCSVNAADAGSASWTFSATVSTPPSPVVNAGGGTVDLLDFVFTGDTRPYQCNDLANYPDATFKQEVARMATMAPQFGLDLGDHMYECDGNLAAARAQMKKYTDAIAGGGFKPPWFMTMGNHECSVAFLGRDCSGLASSDANYVAYREALQALSQQALPYYKLDFATRHGLARFVFLADDYADATAQTWAENTLAEADQKAVYTIVAKHHPMTGSRTGPAWARDVVLRHKYSLVLTAHTHDYEHDTVAYAGRTVICGLGAANPNWTGFCRVRQHGDKTLEFTAYDLYGNVRTNPSSTFVVAPQ